MRGARVLWQGGRRHLVATEVPDAGAPTGRQVLLRVEAASLNGSDRMLVDGLLPPLPGMADRIRPGFDVVGRVVARGPLVTSCDDGDRVAALLPHSGGGLAEQVLVDARRLALVPDGVSSDRAAAVVLAGLTALQALVVAARLRARSRPRVLVVGAGGGIGAFATQLARRGGAEVTATARPAQVDAVRGLGAHHVLTARAEEVTPSGGAWDVVLDTPGALRPDAARPLLTADGVHVTTRAASARTLLGVASTAANSALGRDARRTLLVTTRPTTGDLAHLLDLLRRGELDPVLDSTWPLDEVTRAEERLRGGAVGKVVVTP